MRELVLPALTAQGDIEAWIIDDTGFAKKGVHSVGVARQYCGRLQACASPGLFYQAGLDDNLSSDLQNLFQTAVATAHLTQ